MNRVLLLDEAGAGAAWIETMLAGGGGSGSCEFVRCASLASAREALATSQFDLICVGCGCSATAGLDAIKAIRGIDASVPIIAITRHVDESLGMLAIQAGAQDYLVEDETNLGRLHRAMDYAIERGRLLERLEEARSDEATEQEFHRLKSLCGPAPLPVSGNSFGSIPLRKRSPQAFLDMAQRYEDLLERSPAARTFQQRGLIAEELNDIADRLGGLNAGPRDVIDLHKLSIAKRLEGQSMGRARASIEEARMLLLQLMGYLASFYRNLSWGSGAASRSWPAQGRMLANPEASSRKTEK